MKRGVVGAAVEIRRESVSEFRAPQEGLRSNFKSFAPAKGKAPQKRCFSFGEDKLSPRHAEHAGQQRRSAAGADEARCCGRSGRILPARAESKFRAPQEGCEATSSHSAPAKAKAPQSGAFALAKNELA
jgi:hypothetical protein